MEAAGLGIGIAGLAGLFSACLEAIDKVKAYKSFTNDADALNVQYDAHRLRLDRWGRSVGLADGQLSADHHPHLDDNQTRSSVADLLRIITGILGDGGAKESGRGLTSLLKNTTLGSTVNQPRTRQGVSESKTRKLAWALGGKGDRTVQVKLLGELVQQLHYLVPLERQDSTHLTPDTGSRGALRGADPLSKVPTAGTQSEHGWAGLLQALAQVQAETRREVHAWVLGQRFPNERYEDSRNKKLPGTCDWILTRPAFTRWSAEPPADTSELLWINGRPGFGKTILCSRIVEYLSAIPDRLVAHFFLSSDHETRNDPYAVMRSWLCQLASHSDVYDLIRQRWVTTQDLVATRATVIQLLRNALQARPGCYLVVDGLDECTAPADSSSSVAGFLEDVVKNAITPATRVLIVSRDEPEIRQTLRAGDTYRLTEYQISPGDVHNDATAFSRFIVDRKLSNKPEGIRASLSKTMTDRCDGQFLWLLLQEQSLKSWKNLAQLQRGLDGAPAGLNNLYERNWTKITNSDRADRAVALLRWAVFALRPLTVGEIIEAVLIDDECDGLLVDELPDVIDDDYISSEILGLCGPLVEVRGSRSAAGTRIVHLAHFTIREFLVKRLPIGNIWQNETLRVSNENIQNTIIARSCLWYIQSQQAWQDNDATPESPFQAVLRDYAAASWHAHLKSGVPPNHDPGTLESVLAFMNEGRSCWNAWRSWVDTHDDDEAEAAEAEEIPPGPSYYALKFGLPAVAVLHIQRHGPGRITTSTGRSVLELCCTQGNILLAEVILNAGVDIETKARRARTPLYSASLHGQFTVVQALLQRGARVEVMNQYGWTPVNAAASNGHLEVVKYLVENGADTTVAANDGWTPVHSAAESGHLEVVKFLVEKGADITVADNDGWTPVHSAAMHGHLEVVKFLVEKGADITVADNNGWTLVIFAAGNGHLEVVKFLVEKGADITVADNEGQTPVIFAAGNDHLEVVKFLVEKGADITVADNDGWTPVHSAAMHGHLEVVKFLVEKGADITVADNNGWTLVIFAAGNGHLEVVKFLVEKGADITVADNDGWTLVHLAAFHGHLEVVKFLVEKGADITVADNEGQTPVKLAAESGHLEVVKFLVEKGADITVASSNGRTPVIFAAINGRLEVVKFLAEKGADITVADNDGWTPVIFAAGNDHLEVVKFLVEKGADITVADSDGWTPVHSAAMHGHLEVVKFLVEKGANITVADNARQTPVKLAAESGHLEVVKFLVEKGADITVASSNGLTPVIFAAINGHLEVVKFLVEKGADITVASSNGRTPVMFAAINGRLEVVKFLAEKGADITVADNDGWTPVIFAAGNDHLEVVKFLVEKGADITVADNEGQTPVIFAAGNDHLEVVKFLVEKGADITVADNDGWTPVLISSTKGYTGVVRSLVLSGQVNPNSMSKSGRTPLSMAAHKSHEAIVQLLLETDGVDLNSRDEMGCTPLMWASRSADMASLRLLCDSGADIDAEDMCGLTALQLAVFTFNSAAEQVLLEHGAFEPSDFFGFEVLFNAE